MSTNVKTPLVFSKRLRAYQLRNADNYAIETRTIVINLGETEAVVDSPQPAKPIHPRTSTILQGANILESDSLICVEVPDPPESLSGIFLDEGWQHLTQKVPQYPADVPLYISPQFTVGKVKLDPFFVCDQAPAPDLGKFKVYEVKVNLWFCPEMTHCGIHNVHANPEILEVHTQIYGTGRMQKFRENDHSTIYEDVIMCPGMTHAPFAGVQSDGQMYYGWHQYYSETDCIWMACEFHPVS